jgi:hypothetical protein
MKAPDLSRASGSGNVFECLNLTSQIQVWTTSASNPRRMAGYFIPYGGPRSNHYRVLGFPAPARLSQTTSTFTNSHSMAFLRGSPSKPPDRGNTLGKTQGTSGSERSSQSRAGIASTHKFQRALRQVRRYEIKSPHWPWQWPDAGPG